MKRLILAISAVLMSFSLPAAAEFPEDGRTITMIVPFSAGGGTDTFARQVAPVMSEVLGVPVEIVNKPGAASQVGITEVSISKPDGYTLGWIIFPTSLAYLNPDRQSAYTREDLEPIGPAFEVSTAITVLASSPYQTLSDLVDAAKATPGELKSGTPGLMSTSMLANLGFQRSVDIDMAMVNFKGGAPQLTALLGGHIDVGFLGINEALPQSEERGGDLRVLGVMSDDENPYGLPTVKSQGFDTQPFAPDVGVVGPAGIPADVIAKLSDALRQALEDDSVKPGAEKIGNNIRYMSPEDYSAHWAKVEAKFKPLIDIARQQQAQ